MSMIPQNVINQKLEISYDEIEKKLEDSIAYETLTFNSS